MNEASSKYVDQIATQRLLDEKLRHVHHSPNPARRRVDASFRDFALLSPQPAEVTSVRKKQFVEVAFTSALHTEYRNNNKVRCQCYQATQSNADLILVHGLYEDNLQIYDFLVSMLNAQGLDVYLLLLPYHYDRKPASSLFSGEFFWSADIDRSMLAHKQAVYDLYQLWGYVRSRAERPAWISGFSMGGGIVLSLSALVALDGVCVINPVCNMSKLIWNSTLFSTIRQDLEANGITFEHLVTRYSVYEPLNTDSIQTDVTKIALLRGLYDQINDSSNYDLLADRWGLRVLTYKAGHLNILRVPRLAADIHRFFQEGLSDELL